MLQLKKPLSTSILITYQNKTGNIYEKEIEKITKEYSAYVIAYLEPMYACPNELELDVFFSQRLLPNIKEKQTIAYVSQKYLSPMFQEPTKELIVL